MTNDAKCTREIKSRIVVATAGFRKKKKNLFTSKLHINKRKNSKMLNFEHSLVWCENLDTSENRSEIPGKF